MRHRITASLSLFAFTLVAGCMPDRSAPLSPQQEGEQMWQMVCTNCHGQTGMGDGPGAAALNPKPRSFRDGTWQASVTDEHIQKTILEGGGGVGKSPLMPAQAQLKSKPEVVATLVQRVRRFRPAQ